jgi:3-hydroxyacyl-[acyl-carrier-protein] dehydratase
MKLYKSEILEYQKNRDEFLMFDEVTKVTPGKSANGFKVLDKDLWFFKLHWPGDPNMPGMLQIEALIQLCAMAIFTLPNNKGKTVYLLNVNKAKFYKKVVPGNNFEINTEIKSYKRGLAICNGTGYQDNVRSCSAEFSMILKDFTINMLNPKNK